MAETSIAQCIQKLLKLQKDLRLSKNGPTKAAVANGMDSIIACLKNYSSKSQEKPEDLNNRNEESPPLLKKSSPKPAPAADIDKIYPQLPESKPTRGGPENLSPAVSPRKNLVTRIYPRLSNVHTLEPSAEGDNQSTQAKQCHKLFSSNSYKHEINRKERLISVVKKSNKIISSREVVAIVDSHPNWQLLHKYAPNTAIIQVGGLCFPSAAAGIDSLAAAGLSFPSTKQIITALGCNDIAHAHNAHHNLSAYSESWLPYFSSSIKKLFPNATIKFVLPFSSKTIPQHTIDTLQRQLTETFPGHEILHSPYYTPYDFHDHIHLNSLAQQGYTTFLAKVITNGKLCNTSVKECVIHQPRAVPLMKLNLHRPQKVRNIDTPTYHPQINNRTYAQVVANNTTTSSTHEILHQLTCLLPKLINVISNYS